MAQYKSTFILNDKVSPVFKKIAANSRLLDRNLGRTTKNLEMIQKRFENISKFGNKLKGIGQGLTVGVTLPVIAAGGAMVKLASDMEETLNKVDVSFGNNSDRVKEWAKTSIKSMGLAQQSALDSAALYGDMATGMGMAQDKAADMAMSLTQLGADLASFKNISNDVAQTALKSIFTGETESLKNLGVVMTEANLQQYGLEKGMLRMVAANKKGSKARIQRINELSQTEQVLLRYNYVLEKTKNAHGDFERTGGGAANQTRMFQEQLKELGVTFGQYILPYFTKAVKRLNGMLTAFNSLSPGAKKTILVIGGLAAAIGPLLMVGGSLLIFLAQLPKNLLLAKLGLDVLKKGVLGFAKSLVWLFTNPVGLTIVAIGALIGIIVLLVKNWDKVKEVAINAGQAIATWWKGLVDGFKNWLGEMIEGLNALIDRLGFLAYFIPGLSGIKLAKDVAGAIGNRTSNDNRQWNSNDNRSNFGNTYQTVNNYNSMFPLSNAQYFAPNS